MTTTNTTIPALPTGNASESLLRIRKTVPLALCSVAADAVNALNAIKSDLDRTNLDVNSEVYSLLSALTIRLQNLTLDGTTVHSMWAKVPPIAYVADVQAPSPGPSGPFVIYNRKLDAYAATATDWNANITAPDVLRFDTFNDAMAFLSEYPMSAGFVDANVYAVPAPTAPIVAKSKTDDTPATAPITPVVQGNDIDNLRTLLLNAFKSDPRITSKKAREIIGARNGWKDIVSGLIGDGSIHVAGKAGRGEVYAIGPAPSAPVQGEKVFTDEEVLAVANAVNSPAMLATVIAVAAITTPTPDADPLAGWDDAAPVNTDPAPTYLPNCTHPLPPADAVIVGHINPKTDAPTPVIPPAPSADVVKVMDAVFQGVNTDALLAELTRRVKAIQSGREFHDGIRALNVLRDVLSPQ